MFIGHIPALLLHIEDGAVGAGDLLAGLHGGGGVLDAAHLLLHVPIALAATWTVEADGSGDVATLQQALDRATDGDRVEAGAGIYEENLDFRGLDVTVTGADGAVLIPASTSIPLVAFSSGEGPGAVLEGFTLDGDGGSTVTISGADPTLRDLRLRDFSGDIGGALVVTDGSVTIEDTVFTENSAETGAAIWAERAVVMLSNCTLSGNAALDAGGGSYNATGHNSVFTGNSSANTGGGAHFGTLNNCTLTGNSAQQGGGILSCILNNCILFIRN